MTYATKSFHAAPSVGPSARMSNVPHRPAADRPSFSDRLGLALILGALMLVFLGLTKIFGRR